MLNILIWIEKLKQIIKFLNLKLIRKSELLSIRIFLVNFTLAIGQEKYLLSILFWKLILGNIKLKIWTKKNNRKFLWKRIVAE